uniref:Uncharacterized protein n=1 Tax=Knufia peltigerae TaxID=1002370 RepID=A0AA38Y299_9EURO|nr:hypothetical protein H2204_007355 [Knufia peltigerae]
MRQLAEGRQQLCGIRLRIARLAANAQITLPQPIARRIKRRPQQVVPHGQEQAEIDVARSAIADVVEAMQRRPCHHPAQHTRAHVHVGMLQQQLDRNGKRQHCGHRHRHAQQQQRQYAAHRFGGLVQWVFHQTIEAIHAGHAVMHRMQPPQPADAMAGVVHQGDAKVSRDDRHQHLQREWPLHRPDVPGHDRRQQRHRGDRQQVQAFIDQRMQDVAQAVTLVVVERRIVRPQPFGSERHRDGDSQQGKQPQRVTVGVADPGDGSGNKTQQEQRGIQAEHPVFHGQPGK